MAINQMACEIRQRPRKGKGNPRRHI